MTKIFQIFLYFTIINLFYNILFAMKYNFETLKNYALWYYFRYFPSSSKLLQKLEEKVEDRELSKKVFENISHLINDTQVIWDKIRLYLIRNKNLKYIKNKLVLAWFDKYLVQEILAQDFLQEWESLLNKKSLFIKIENYKKAWKSINYIRQKLVERPEDREVVEWIIEEIFDSWEKENILRELEKLKNKFDKQKIIWKLTQKWFNYNEIKRYV